MTDAPLRVAEVGLGRETFYARSQRFIDFAALLEAPRFDAIVIDAALEDRIDLLRRLRAHPAHRLSLIYCLHGEDAMTQALADGPPPREAPMLERQCRQHRERLAVFNNGRAPQGPEAQLLAYLWLRTPGSLRAVRDPGNAQHYDYPLARCLGGESINSQALVRNLVQRDLLESVALVDRIRLCRRCGSGQLNYVDVCVECNALDIRRQASLHCFTCGHIGRQGEFLKDGALVCPNCLTRLRHIGSDYDRPLENYTCNA